MFLSAQIYVMNALNRMFAGTSEALGSLPQDLMDMVTNIIGPVQKIGCVILAAMCLFFVIKALAGDEQDVKQSIKRAKVCFVAFIILLAFTSIINALIGAMGGGLTVGTKVTTTE